MLKLGRDILPGMLALHSCDRRQCVNPKHLREGTYGDNSADKVARRKGRTSKLTPEMMCEIERMFEAGEHYSDIASKFQVSVHTVYAVYKGYPLRSGAIRFRNSVPERVALAVAEQLAAGRPLASVATEFGLPKAVAEAVARDVRTKEKPV